MTCYVYVIEADGRVKIGLSSNPRARMAGLSTALAVEPQLVHRWRLPDREAAEAAERALHRAFAHARLRGEWFALPTDEAIGVGECVLAGDDEGARERRRLYRQHHRFEANWQRRSMERPRRDRLRLVERSWRLFRRSNERMMAAGLLFNPWDFITA